MERRKWTSLLIVFAMLFTILPFNIFAQEEGNSAVNTDKTIGMDVNEGLKVDEPESKNSISPLSGAAEPSVKFVNPETAENISVTTERGSGPVNFEVEADYDDQKYTVSYEWQLHDGNPIQGVTLTDTNENSSTLNIGSNSVTTAFAVRLKTIFTPIDPNDQGGQKIVRSRAQIYVTEPVPVEEPSVQFVNPKTGKNISVTTERGSGPVNLEVEADYDDQKYTVSYEWQLHDGNPIQGVTLTDTNENSSTLNIGSNSVTTAFAVRLKTIFTPIDPNDQGGQKIVRSRAQIYVTEPAPTPTVSISTEGDNTIVKGVPKTFEAIVENFEGYTTSFEWSAVENSIVRNIEGITIEKDTENPAIVTVTVGEEVDLESFDLKVEVTLTPEETNEGTIAAINLLRSIARTDDGPIEITGTKTITIEDPSVSIENDDIQTDDEGKFIEIKRNESKTLEAQIESPEGYDVAYLWSAEEVLPNGVTNTDVTGQTITVTASETAELGTIKGKVTATFTKTDGTTVDKVDTIKILIVEDDTPSPGQEPKVTITGDDLIKKGEPKTFTATPSDNEGYTPSYAWSIVGSPEDVEIVENDDTATVTVSEDTTLESFGIKVDAEFTLDDNAPNMVNALRKMSREVKTVSDTKTVTIEEKTTEPSEKEYNLTIKPINSISSVSGAEKERNQKVKAGEEVTIKAYRYKNNNSNNGEFKDWDVTGLDDYDDETIRTITFIMPEEDVTIEPIYKDSSNSGGGSTSTRDLEILRVEIYRNALVIQVNKDGSRVYLEEENKSYDDKAADKKEGSNKYNAVFWENFYDKVDRKDFYVFAKKGSDKTSRIKLDGSSSKIHIYNKNYDGTEDKTKAPIVTRGVAGELKLEGRGVVKGATVEVKDNNGTKLGTATADNDGKFTVNLNRALKVGEKLDVIAKESGKSDATTTYVVIKEETTTALTGYINGYADGTFRPNNNMTRAEAATMMARLINGSGNFGTSKSTRFSDSNNQWYSEAINYVTEKGLINGYTDGTFRPNNRITRAEFTQMISKYLTSTGTRQVSFNDVNGHWAESAIEKVAGNGIIDGYTDGSFKPNRQISRAEATKILNGTFKIKDSGNYTRTFTDVRSSDWFYNDVMRAANYK